MSRKKKAVVISGKHGGPKDYLYKPEFCELLIEWMRQGFTLTTFPNELERKHNIRVTVQCLYQWMSLEPEFKEAYAVAKQKSQEFFEKLLLASVTGVTPKGLLEAGSTGINASSLMFILKTRFSHDYGQVYRVCADADKELKGDQLEGRLRLQDLSDETIKLMIQDAKIKERDERNTIPGHARTVRKSTVSDERTRKRASSKRTRKKFS